MSIEPVMPSNHLIPCHPLLLLPSIFPASGSFPVSQFFPLGGQSIGASALASVLPMNIQGWFPLGLTGFDLLAVQGTLKSLFQHHSSKCRILIPRLGIEPVPPAVEAQSLKHWTIKEVPPHLHKGQPSRIWNTHPKSPPPLWYVRLTKQSGLLLPWASKCNHLLSFFK